jgi:YHS domain-containing protein
MADIDKLLNRIDAEWNAMESKIKQFQSQRVQEFQDREKRQEQVVKLLDGMRDVWRPRLEALAKKFGERVNVSPTVEPGRRTATFKFQSQLARIDLRFSVFTDPDVRQVIFNYNLDILPIFIKFESNTSIVFALESVDREQLANWIDDRIVDFVKTYMELHENHYYLKDHLVEDPIAKVRLPKFAAAATVEWQGKGYYFISDETRREFEKQKGIK